MKKLIEAFTIFAKYIPDEPHPTHCEHDELFVMCDPDLVSDEDKAKLSELDFDPTPDGDSFRSFTYGSA